MSRCRCGVWPTRAHPTSVLVGHSGWGGGKGFAHQLWGLGGERCLRKQLLTAQAL